jgi:hypothetical protein
VDVDTLRGTRRTAELTLLNKGADFVPNNEWTGKFYLNRAIRLYRGVVLADGEYEYVPIGTFLIDHAEVIVERNMSMVVLSMSDMWKKFNKSVFLNPGSFAEDTHINDIIRTLANAVGANEPLSPNLDPLEGAWRDTNNRRLWRKLKYERGENRGEFLKKLCRRYGIDIYFDPKGRLTTQDRREPKDKEKVWTFHSRPDGTGMLVSLRRSFNDDNLYNHVYAVGSGDPKNIVKHEIKDENPGSLTSINRIGDRVLLLENDRIEKESEIREAARLAWQKRFNIYEEVNGRVICNPALDGDDVVEFINDAANIRGLYRIQHLNIPLSSSSQEIKCTNIIRDY